MSVALIHTILCIFIRDIYNFICGFLYNFIYPFVLRRPFVGLRQAQQYKNQPDIGVIGFKIQYRFSRKSVKPQCAACDEICISVVYQLNNCVFQPPSKLIKLLRRYFSMSCKADCIIFFVPLRITSNTKNINSFISTFIVYHIQK